MLYYYYSELEREISSCNISRTYCHKSEKHVTFRDQQKINIDKPFVEDVQFILTHDTKEGTNITSYKTEEIKVHIKTHSVNHQPEHKH